VFQARSIASFGGWRSLGCRVGSPDTAVTAHVQGEHVVWRGHLDSDVNDRLRHPIDPEEEDGYGSSWRRVWDGRRYHTREHLTRDHGPLDPSVYGWAVEHDSHCIGSAQLRVDPDQHCATYSVGLFVAGLRGRGLGREITGLVLSWASRVLGARTSSVRNPESNDRTM